MKTNSMWKSKRGILDQLSDLMKGLAVVAIIAVVVTLILANVLQNGSVAANTNATAATNKMINLVGSTIDWVPLVVLVAIGAMLLAMIYMFNRKTD